MMHQNAHTSIQLVHPRSESTETQTIFYQGILASQTQIAKYIGSRTMSCSTGQWMRCLGRNNLRPINVLINPFIGDEIKDINTEPFQSFISLLNPLTLSASSISWLINWYYGIQINDQNTSLEKHGDIRNNALNISEISVGQETDIESHYQKYQRWKENNTHKNLILWGVSRGAATTFNAFSQYKYPEVKLVILEGCFYSLEDVLSKWFFSPLSPFVRAGLNLFTKYRDDGPSPKKNIENFPEGVPVVFITSKIDKIVPCSSTEKLAYELAKKHKNEVYLLKLERSSHPNYMFDDAEDRERYEAFINAIYKKYNFTDLPYDAGLAAKGLAILNESLIKDSDLDNTPSVAHSIK